MTEALEPEVLTEDKGEKQNESIEQPAKVVRVGTMMRQLLEEVKSSPLDDQSRGRLKEIYQSSITELGSALSDDLRDELNRLASPFGGETSPSNDELRIAQAQLVGWLEGLIQGIQAAMFAHQFMNDPQVEDLKPGMLNPGDEDKPDLGDDRPGNYL
ncbi:MAG: DUF2587 domain-containing protein [Acidimicrobiales bacterium]|nr:DUF2587 domain-containing protein [Acidimicrobiales bacterium]